MKLKFKTPHLSIGSFNPIELPNFAVLTGINGAGKTHLFDAIKHGHVTVDDIPKRLTKTFLQSDFRLYQDEKIEGHRMENVIDVAWADYTSEKKDDMSFIKIMEEIHDEFFYSRKNKITSNLLEKLPSNTSLWDVQNQLTIISPTLATAINQYIEKVEYFFASPLFDSIAHPADIAKALRKYKGKIHQISFEEFRYLFVPSNRISYRGYLSTSLANIFTQYCIGQFLWAHRQWDKGSISFSKEDFYLQYEKEYEKPWVIINEIFTEVRSYTEQESVFNFSITNPEKEKESLQISNWRHFSFDPKLIDQRDGGIREFSDLSSGEQVLLALVISIYQSRDNYKLPELLLLDEVDASLHPSMTKALLTTLQNVLVKRGTKIILATHSPSTVALAPEGSTFVIHKGQPEVKIEKKSNSEALELLTEGYMTLERGLAIFDEVLKHEVSIITEGFNTKYIERVLKMYDQSDIGIIKGIEDCTGKNQLTTLFQIFRKLPISKPILFIFDCDVGSKLKESGNTFTLTLPKNQENTICPKGIENIFPEYLFDGFINEFKNSRGEIQRSFDSKQRKRDFEQHVLENAKASDYKNFKVIIDKIEKIKSP